MKFEFTNGEMELFLNPFMTAIRTSAELNAKVNALQNKINEHDEKIREATIKVQQQYEPIVKQLKKDLKEAQELSATNEASLLKKTKEEADLTSKLETTIKDLEVANENAKGHTFWKNSQDRLSKLMTLMNPKDEDCKEAAVKLIQSLLGSSNPQDAIDIVAGKFEAKPVETSFTLIDALKKDLSPGVIPADKLDELKNVVQF